MSAERQRRRPVRSWMALAGGLLVLTLLWAGPLPAASRTMFSVHMMLHLGLVLVAAPLLALPLARRLPQPPSFGDALRWFLLAAAFEMLAIWSWHVPLLHDAAGRTTGWFMVEQLSFLAGAIALWTAILSARTAAAAAAAAIASFLTFSHMTMFGLLLSLTPRLIYDPDLCRGGFGLGGLDDQHLGGALMAAGGLVYLGATAVLCARAIATHGPSKTHEFSAAE